MKAIVEISGKQYMVSKDQELLVNKLAKDSKKAKIEKVLMIFDGFDTFDKLSFESEPEGSSLRVEDSTGKLTTGKKIKIGKPFIDESYVEIEVLGEERGEKVQIIKHRAKKRERKKIGFTPRFSKIKVTKIV